MEDDAEDASFYPLPDPMSLCGAKLSKAVMLHQFDVQWKERLATKNYLVCEQEKAGRHEPWTTRPLA